jgi:hypothetical protein
MEVRVYSISEYPAIYDASEYRNFYVIIMQLIQSRKAGYFLHESV